MVQGKFTPNLGEWNLLGCKEKDKASAHTTHKLCVKKKKKEKYDDVTRSKANESEKLMSKLSA